MIPTALYLNLHAIIRIRRFIASGRPIDFKDNIDLASVVLPHALLHELLLFVLYPVLVDDSDVVLGDGLRNDFVAPQQSDYSLEFVVLFEADVASVAPVDVDLQFHAFASNLD